MKAIEMIQNEKQRDYSEQVEHDSDDFFEDLAPHTVKEVMKEIACEIIETKRELAAAQAVEEYLRNKEIYGK